MQVKYILGLVVAGITASGIASNLKTPNNVALADSKPKVVASHNIICDLLQTVAQDTIELTCLIGANQDPHTYRPTPSQRKAIEEAQLIFYGGYKLEPQIVNLFTDQETPTIPLYEQAVSEPIMVEEGHHEEAHHEEDHHEEDHHEEDHHEEAHQEEGHDEETKPAAEAKTEPDPHVWHNIENTVRMVELIRSIFLQLNPQVAEQYLLNSVNLTEQLWQLDAWIKDQLDTIPEEQKILVTTHESLNYYAEAYYLADYLTLQGLGGEASPTASQVRELSSKIKQTGVPTIFAESTKSDRVIQNVARAADVKLSEKPLYVDGLGEAANYIEMMSHNTCVIVDGLGGECEPFNLGN